MFKRLNVFGKNGAVLLLCVMLACALMFGAFARPALASEDDDVPGITSTDPEDKSSESDSGDGEPILATGNDDGESEDEDAGDEEADEEEKVEFVLFDKMAGLSPVEWLMFSAALAIATGTAVYLVMRAKRSKERALYGYEPPKKERMSTQVLVYGALCVALSFALSYIKLFSMPTGGSITLASMLPLCVYSNRFGFKNGLLACVVYGVLQFLQSMYILSIPQVLLEYPLAFGMIAIGGLFRKLPVSILVGCFLRFLCHFFASVIFWKEYLDPSYNMWVASLIYNGIYMGIDTAICLVISLLPPFGKAIDRILPARSEKYFTIA